MKPAGRLPETAAKALLVNILALSAGRSNESTKPINYGGRSKAGAKNQVMPL
jgi:hypothetical protein